MKCDETKPICLRCQKFGIGNECGYATLFRRRTKTLEPIQPRSLGALENDTRHLKDLIPRYPQLLSINTRNLSAAVPGDTTERRYFEYFREEVAIIICGYFETPFWTRLVPQVCHHEPAIRHEIIALSALYRASRLSSKEKDAKEAHRTFAFIQQSQALRCLRESLSKKNQIARLPLMASLIFTIFESFHGNWETAMQQLSSGRNLLKHSDRKNEQDKEAKYSKASASIEPEIVKALERLEVITLSFLSLNPVYELPVPEEEEYQEIEKLPDRFGSLAMAFPVIVRLATVAFKQVRATARYITSDRSNMSPTEAESQHQAYKRCLMCYQRVERAWNDVVDPILFGKIVPVHSMLYLGALTCHLQGETCAIMIHTCMNLQETVYDSFLERFKSIVGSSVFLLKTEQDYWMKGEPALKFGLGLIFCLYHVATRCRDAEVRREAIAILRQWPTRSGLWDSLQAAKVAEWAGGLEERERGTDGFVPEERRVRMHTLKWTVKDGFINAECFQGGAGGSLKLRRAALLC